MFIDRLRIDRFGTIAELEIGELTDGLTVVQGAAGSGKTTLVHFVRAMLFGFDDTIRAQYLPHDSRGFGGLLTLTHGRDCQIISRYDDGSREGRLSVEHEDGRVIGHKQLRELLGGVSAALFARLFAVDFSRRPDLAGLLDEAAHCGFAATSRKTESSPVTRLQNKLAALQRELSAMPAGDESLESLQARRETLLDDIAALQRRAAVQRDQDGENIAIQIDDLERLLDDSRQQLRSLDEGIEAFAARRHGYRRSSDVDPPAADAESARSPRLPALEAQIGRWRSLLDELAARRQTLESTAQPPRPADVPQHDDQDDDDLLRQPSRLATAACACEAKQLARCQHELAQAIGYLEAARDALRSGAPHGEDQWLRERRDSLADQAAAFQRRRGRVTAAIQQAEADLAALRRRQQAADGDLQPRLDQRCHELDRLEQDIHQAQQRHDCLAAISDLKREIQLLETESSDAEIVEQASAYLRRLSAADFRQLEITHGKHVWVVDQAGHRLSWGHLDEGARDQVYLSLCLSLIEAHYQRGTEIPLILKGPFTNFDSRNVPEAAELLRDFSDRGRQILLLTRHQHVASVFRLLNVPVRQLAVNGPASAARPVTAPPPAPRKSAAGAASPPLDTGHRPPHDGLPEPRFFLTKAAAIEEAPSLDAANSARLRRIGITTIGQLLAAVPRTVAAQLQPAGITAQMVQCWQDQARLVCCVPGLRPYDARILVACGITRPAQLDDVRPGDMRAMIEHFAASSDGQAVLLSGTEFELSRVADWIKSDDVPVEGRAAKHGRRSAARRAAHDDHSASADEHRHDARPQEPRARAQRDVVKLHDVADRQFFLKRTDDVVHAPSIGPRTAERLQNAGVVSVSDLLSADPDELAEQLDNRRINAATIRQWQQQTRLVCCVPGLRGHDAQLLVALGIQEAEQLAGRDPSQLWAEVEPFSKSNQGKRIIRNGKAPDFEEVFNWIQGATDARPLKAA